MYMYTFASFIFCVCVYYTYFIYNTYLHTYTLTHLYTYLHTYILTSLTDLALHYIYIYIYLQISYLHIVPTYCVYIYTYYCFPSRFVPSISHQAKLQGWLQRRKERPPAAPLRLDLVPLAPLAAPVVKLGEEKDRRGVMMKYMKSYL